MADTPAIGEMILYDYFLPPLRDGKYQLHVETDVTVKGASQPLTGSDYRFDVVGPRFSLSPAEVAAVVPPRNGHGYFDSALPHVALSRRTLPWERPLAAGTYDVAPPGRPYPFLALVIFKKEECVLKHNMALEDVVPPAVFKRLGAPAGIRCDAVEADEDLLKGILPRPDELQLLTHVRQVNVEDRELSVGATDGYFAVVTANRFPEAGGDHVACLVSVEERTDLLPTTDPTPPQILDPFVEGVVAAVEGAVAGNVPAPGDVNPQVLGTSMTAASADRVMDIQKYEMNRQETLDIARKRALVNTTDSVDETVLKAQQDLIRHEIGLGSILLRPQARLVLLHSWTFKCEGDGTFRQLMQRLNVGMIGDVDPATKLAVTDTGHIKIDVTDRLGAPEKCWYRGPLVPQPVARDPNGPYHSADQARRIAADTGGENISYASAFEVGRLLAAADARLAQELMRWRRGEYIESVRQYTRNLLASTLNLPSAIGPLDPIALRYSVDVLDKIALGTTDLIDPGNVDTIMSSPLMQPAEIAAAFGLASTAQAQQLLAADSGLSTAVETPAGEATLTDLGAVLADHAGAAMLANAQQLAIQNTAYGAGE